MDLVNSDSGAVEIWEVVDSVLRMRGHAQEHDNYITSVSVFPNAAKGITASADHRYNFRCSVLDSIEYAQKTVLNCGNNI